jgi:hypothetical protein
MKFGSFTRLAGALALIAFASVNAAPPKEAESKPATKTEGKAEAKTDSKGEGKGKAKAKRDTYPLYGEVVAISSRMLTIKGGEGKEDRKYTITSDTKFVNGAKPATIDDVKPGKMVGGSVKKTDGDVKDHVLSINVGVKQDRKAPAAKGEAAKPAAESKSKGKKE